MPDTFAERQGRLGMAWREASVSDQRLEFVMLASLEGANVSSLCERFGISRQTGHVWLRRFAAGERSFADRSRRPLHSPRRLSDELEARILSVRDRHPAWGARKIAAVLRREGTAPPATSTVHAVLLRHGRVAAEAPGRAYGSFERAAPNALWQMDFKGRVRLCNGAWLHPLTVIDDHSRFALGLGACADQRTQTVRTQLEQALRRHGLPEAIYVDNGSPWGGGRPGQWTPLRVWLLKLGIETIHSKPYHPQGRGKNERFHRSLKAELLSLTPLRGFGHAQDAFDRWRHVYNRERPHQALDFATPAERYRPSSRTFPKTLPAPHYEQGEILRRVGGTAPYISFRNKRWKLPEAFRGETIAIRPRMPDGSFAICFGAIQIASFNLNAETNNTPKL
jgi:transposase InsO family protein